MRQIFSVILSAALVFGGALFMAGYFAGIEVRDEIATADEGSINDKAQERDDRVVEYCPTIDDILDYSLPENYLIVSGGHWPIGIDAETGLPDYEGTWPDETFILSSGTLYEPLRPRGESSFTGNLECKYAERYPHEGRWLKTFRIDLVPGLVAEPQRPELWNVRQRGGLHMRGFAKCSGLPRNCGFYIVEEE